MTTTQPTTNDAATRERTAPAASTVVRLRCDAAFLTLILV